MPGEQPKNGGNGTSKLLTVLAQSGNQWVQLATVGLVALSGLGNWVATWNSSDRNKQEIEISRRVAWESNERVRQEVIKQVDDIHQWMKASTEEFHRGNEDSAANKKVLLVFKEELEGFEARQLSVLLNQNKMMESDSQVLNEIHQIAVRLDKLKSEDQMRGAPQ